MLRNWQEYFLTSNGNARFINVPGVGTMDGGNAYSQDSVKNLRRYAGLPR